MSTPATQPPTARTRTADRAGRGRRGITRPRRRPVLTWTVGALVVALVVGLAVALGLLLRAPSYSATATSLVSPAGRTAQESDPYAGSTFVLQRMQTYVDVATSSPVLQKVLEQAGRGLSVQELGSEVTSQNPPSSVLLDVTVKDADPQRAADLANAVAVEQGRAIEELESSSTSSSATPVKVSLVDVAEVPRVRTAAERTLRSAGVGVAAALVVALGLALLNRLRRRPGPARYLPARAAPAEGHER